MSSPSRASRHFSISSLVIFSPRSHRAPTSFSVSSSSGRPSLPPPPEEISLSLEKASLRSSSPRPWLGL